MATDWPEDRREFAYTICQLAEERCRAWQAFRDFLNGSVEQWEQYAEDMYAYGRQLGEEDV